MKKKFNLNWLIKKKKEKKSENQAQIKCFS